jgi:hypothetical protein
MTVDSYCWPPSVAPGEPVGLHVSTDAGAFEVEVAREGAEREPVWRASGTAGDHPTPEDASTAGCGWPVALEIPVGADWRSGYYAVTVTAGGERSDAYLVVRPGAERAPMLLVLSTNTWQAYNDWGGPSLYTGGTHVSFERPFAKGFLVKPEPIGRMMQPEPDREAMGFRNWARPLGLSDWCGGAGWFTYERTFTRWAERAGYRFDVAINQDLEQHPDVLDGHRLYLAVGHDEYWSWGMREAFDRFTAGGGNAAVLSGNTCYWQVRFDDGWVGQTGYKYKADEDPVVGTPDERLVTSAWSDRRIGWPETRTIGATFTRGGYSRYGLGAAEASGGYTVHHPKHWVFEGTGLAAGQEFGAADSIVAYEVDGCAMTTGPDGLPVPTHVDGAPEGLQILATAPAHLWAQLEQPTRYLHEPGELEAASMAIWGDTSPEHLAELTNGHAVLGTFEVPGGGTVVNVGVTDWVLGLDDPVVERITRNILDRLRC